MKTCYIIGAGECPEISITKGSDDIIIAADGGLVHLNRFGIEPDYVIGDFDSFGSVPCGDNVVVLKPEKDVTDLYAAIELGKSKGFESFLIYGATGGRLDHTLANIQLIAFLAQNNIKALICEGKKRITALCNGEIVFSPDFEGYISVFAHSDVCMGVSETGLKYTLKNAELRNTFSLGVSNEFIGQESSVSVADGTLIIMYDEK